MFLSKIKFHFKYLVNEYKYFLRVIFFKKNLRSLTFYISLKFLVDAGFKNLLYKRKFAKDKKNFIQVMTEKLNLSNDWFSNNITTWAAVFKNNNFSNNNPEIIEIGSYEGCSAVFFLNYFENSKITCIETFKGSDEHSKIDFKVVKKNFFSNTRQFNHRISLYEGTSKSYFNSINKKKKYDLIYIDGSHHYNDVLNDANNSFKFLNKNGIIIFDDFLKKYYKDLERDPILAILEFIYKHKKDINIINVGYQMIVKKLTN